jgi:cytochrome c
VKRVSLLLTIAILAACNRSETAVPQTTVSAPPPAAGNADRGKQVAVQFGCGVCHVIPGLEGAEGALGPSLAGVASRPAISEGVVQNTPANMTKYILSPASMNPQSRMPPMGVSPAEAEDITAFLMTLK